MRTLMHQATQCPAPSRLWTPMDPAPHLQAPSTAAFHKLWPGEGEGRWEGGSWADPSDALVSPCWCSRGSFNLPVPHTAATTTAFHYGYTHLLATPACSHGIWPTPSVTHTHVCPHPRFLVHTCRDQRVSLPLHCLSAWRGHTVRPCSAHLWCPHPASGHQLGLLGAQPLCPKQ